MLSHLLCLSTKKTQSKAWITAGIPQTTCTHTRTSALRQASSFLYPCPRSTPCFSSSWHRGPILNLSNLQCMLRCSFACQLACRGTGSTPTLESNNTAMSAPRIHVVLKLGRRRQRFIVVSNPLVYCRLHEVTFLRGRAIQAAGRGTLRTIRHFVRQNLKTHGQVL